MRVYRQLGGMATRRDMEHLPGHLVAWRTPNPTSIWGEAEAACSGIRAWGRGLPWCPGGFLVVGGLLVVSCDISSGSLVISESPDCFSGGSSRV